MTWALALQLVLPGDRAGRVRLLLMTSGVALGVALLLGVASVLPAVDARQQVLQNRIPAYTYDASGPQVRSEGVAVTATTGFWRSRELHALRFTVVGPPVPPPEGIDRLPAAGEVLVSPALQQALDGPYGAELLPRIPGRVTGTVGPAGLTGPDELFLVAPAAPSTAVEGDELAAGFTPKGPAAGTTTVREELGIAVPLAGVALVIPIAVLISTSTRLSAASRERRTAAMRLVGATRRQLTQLAVAEGAAVGLAGATLGLGLFLLLRGPAGALLPVPDGVHTASLLPGPGGLLLVLLGVPLVAALTGPLALRRVVSSPLGVTRQARPSKAGALRLLPLAAGLVLLLAAYVNRASVVDAEGPVLALLLSGAALSLLGLAVAGAALARAGGAALARWGRGPASQLAGRRLVLDPSSAARTVTGTALVVAVGGWVLAFIPLLDQAQNGYLRESLTGIRPATVLAGLNGPTQDVDVRALTGVDGVQDVVTLDSLRVVREGTALPLAEASGPPDGSVPTTYSAAVADCAALQLVLTAPLVGCRPGEVQLIALTGLGTAPLIAFGAPPPQGRFTALTTDGAQAVGRPIDVTAQTPVLEVPSRSTGVPWLDQATILIPPSLMPAPPGTVDSSTVLVTTDGTAGAVEGTRSVLATTTTQAPPLTPAEMISQASRTTDAYRTAALVGLLVVVLAGGITLAVSTADGLRERHRAHAALVALGTPMSVLRTSVVLQVATPLLLTVALAVASSAIASHVYLALAAVGDVALPLPWVGYGAVAVAAVVATLLATAAALPLLRAAGRPGALRTE